MRKNLFIVLLTAQLGFFGFGCAKQDFSLIEQRQLAITSPLNARAQAILAQNFAAGNAAHWEQAIIAGAGVPLYRPDLSEPAYFEFAVINIDEHDGSSSPAGYIILSTGPHDYPVMEWTDQGISRTQMLRQQAQQLGKTPQRYYMLDPGAFAVEDNEGQLIFKTGAPLISRQAHYQQQSWSAYKTDYLYEHSDRLAALQSRVAGLWTQNGQPANIDEHAAAQNLDNVPRTSSFASSATADKCSAWQTYLAGTQADQRWYRQLAAGEGPNNASCFSGCGATAWAMLLGWADYRAAQNDPKWKNAWGIFRLSNGGASAPDAVAPAIIDEKNDSQGAKGIMNMLVEIRDEMGTVCAAQQQGLTWPWDMNKAGNYLKNRSAIKLSTSYNALGLPSDDKRQIATEALRLRQTPIVTALGWEHYPLAYGYRTRTCPSSLGGQATEYEFLINDGHTQNLNAPDYRWTSTDIWFVGEIFP